MIDLAGLDVRARSFPGGPPRDHVAISGDELLDLVQEILSARAAERSRTRRDEVLRAGLRELVVDVMALIDIVVPGSARSALAATLEEATAAEPPPDETS